MKLTVDAVVFGYQDTDLKVLLIKRKYEPYKGKYAFPGGFVLEHERTRETVIRELKEETNITVDYLEQLYTFSRVDRDPRERIVTVAYYALVNPNKFQILASTDADSVEWVSVKMIKNTDIAFDHVGILEYALTRLRNKIKYEPIGFDLLPTEFTLTDLYNLYSSILVIGVDKRNFFKLVKKMEFIKPLKKFETTVKRGKKARYYTFDEKKYLLAKKNGINFWL